MKDQQPIPVRMAIIAATLAIATAGCESLSNKADQAASNCENIRPDIIDLSEKDRASRGFALVAIYDPTEISKSDNELKCRGKASWSDNDNTGITYRQYIDQEGTIMLEYMPE